MKDLGSLINAYRIPSLKRMYNGDITEDTIEFLRELKDHDDCGYAAAMQEVIMLMPQPDVLDYVLECLDETKGMKKPEMIEQIEHTKLVVKRKADKFNQNVALAKAMKK